MCYFSFWTGKFSVTIGTSRSLFPGHPSASTLPPAHFFYAWHSLIVIGPSHLTKFEMSPTSKLTSEKSKSCTQQLNVSHVAMCVQALVVIVSGHSMYTHLKCPFRLFSAKHLQYPRHFHPRARNFLLSCSP